MSAVVLAVGLGLLALAQSIPVYLAAWLVIGMGMGGGLYDPAFATLGRIYGEAARPAITTLTLFGGFASTVCWPLSAFLVTHLGWRGACLAYAGLHLLVVLPIYLWALQPEAERAVNVVAPKATAAPVVRRSRTLFVLLATTITLSAMISTLLSVHLLTIPQSRGVPLAVAVALGALVGPSQVGARTIELFIARHHHPIWTKIASTMLVLAGVTILWASPLFLAAPLVLYGAGIGLESIARGTLPLALFGGADYAVMMGRLAKPSLIVQAAAPSIGAVLLSIYGSNGTLITLMLVAATLPWRSPCLASSIVFPGTSPRRNRDLRNGHYRLRGLKPSKQAQSLNPCRMLRRKSASAAAAAFVARSGPLASVWPK